MQRDSFERFYYEKVGLGEGCGCAEHVTRIRDLDALAARRKAAADLLQVRPRPLVLLRHLLLHLRKGASGLDRLSPAHKKEPA